MSTISPNRTLSGHVSFKASVSQALQMAKRGVIKASRTPEQFFDVTLQPVLFTVMFTYIFGGAIAGDPLSYLAFFVPGILVQTIITTTVVTGVQLREDMDKGVFDRFKSLPISRMAPLTGALLADTLRYTLGTTITFLTAFVMGWRPAGGAGAVVLAGALMVLAAWCLSWVFAFFGLTARSATAVQGISMLILFPLTFLSSAYVPTDTMPDWLQAFVEINPLTHLINGFRSLLDGDGVTTDIWGALIGAGVVVLVFAPLTLLQYKRRS